MFTPKASPRIDRVMDSASFCSPEQLTVSGSFSWSTNRATLLLVFQLQSTIVAEIVLESFAELRRCTTHFANPPVLAAKLSPCGVPEFFRVASFTRRLPHRWRAVTPKGGDLNANSPMGVLPSTYQWTTFECCELSVVPQTAHRFEASSLRLAGYGLSSRRCFPC